MTPPASTSGVAAPPPAEREREAFRRPSVAAGGVQALAFRGVEVSAQLLLVIVTARLMEPAGRGLFALASLTMLLCSLPLGAVWSATAIEVARERTPLRELLGASLRIAAIGGLVTGGIALGVAASLGDRWWVVAFPAVFAPAILLARYGEGLYQAVGHVRAVNYITLARVLLPLAFIAPPLLAGVGSRTAVGMWALSLPTLALVIYVPLRRMIGAPRRASDGGLYRRLVGTGTKLAVGNSALLANSRISLIALAAFKSDATVGVYSVAVAASEMLYLTTYSLASSSFRGIGSSERAASIRLTARSVRHALLLSSVGGVLIVPAAFIGLHLIVGGGYGDVPSIMLLLIPGVVGQAGFWTLHTFFTVQLGRPTIINRISVATMATNVAFTLALVPPFGAWGAAAAATVGNAVAALLSFTNFRRHAGIPIRKLRPGRAELADYVTLARALRARIRAARA